MLSRAAIFVIEIDDFCCFLQLLDTEAALRHEQALHIVNKTQVQSLEDENHRLRTEITTLRRRLASATTTEVDR